LRRVGIHETRLDIHAIYVGAAMKRSVRDQVRDWYAGKNGLVSHTEYKFHTWSQCARDAVWSLRTIPLPVETTNAYWVNPEASAT
jgi:hypothetical protein